ncbi:AAA family ATPase [Chitinophaga sp. SYP-B3965]|uniref:AAA family ATPase n=1 Tax=Chitinophaga sp. SYP-B3965 TaxID=2663120 RepID=UPI001299902A|nr:MoxR family ATPase [Chitinophaga sp. SYP-B3965]MRG43724.1 AAA family ATPase [Chitinophaga sp. SYP-B3965]
MEQLNITADKLSQYAQYGKPNIPFVYEIPPELNDAVEVALALDQPLLLTGEPGTGKTTLAEKVAADLHAISNGAFHKTPYRFNTKSTSVFTDLFYSYDAMTHFYDVNIRKEKNPGISDYIELNALGSAIVAGMSAQYPDAVPARNLPPANAPVNSVVLIDEIDKASRDFPNDLLYELEHFSFQIKEAGNRFYKKENDARILVILTSNNEKDLPEAFLRRCVYFNIRFPDDQLLKTILEKHALIHLLQNKEDIVLEYFRELRSICRQKIPSTAELIALCRMIVYRQIDPADKAAWLPILSVVVKHQEDLKLVIEKWR